MVKQSSWLESLGGVPSVWSDRLHHREGIKTRIIFQNRVPFGVRLNKHRLLKINQCDCPFFCAGPHCARDRPSGRQDVL